MIGITFLLLDLSSLFLNVIRNFINTFFSNIFYKNHCEILASIDINQTADVLRFILNKLNDKSGFYLSKNEFAIDFWALFEESPDGFDGIMCECGPVLFGQGIKELKDLIDSDGVLHVSNTFRRRRPSSSHDFFPDGKLSGARNQTTKQNVDTNNNQEVNDQDLFSKESIQNPSGIEGELEYVHLYNL